jgi:hypothetical protein
VSLRQHIDTCWRGREPGDGGLSSRVTNMKIPLTCLLLLALSPGCSTGIIVHDELRAAELVSDFLTSLTTDEGIDLSYAWTDDRYKQVVSRSQFSRIVARIRNRNQLAEIKLIGFETYGPVELISVYAQSQAGSEQLFFRFELTGSKSSDYYLLGLRTESSDYVKEGHYQEYEQPRLINGV